MLKKTTAILAALILLTAWIPKPVTAGAAAQKDLSGRVIIIDAGHGLGNTNVYAGYDEQAAMFKLSQKIKPLLEARGATVHMIRPTQADVPLHARAATINKLALQEVRLSRQKEITRLNEDAAAKAVVAAAMTADVNIPNEIKTLAGKDAAEAKALEDAKTVALTKDIQEIDRLLKIVQSVIDNPKANAPVYLNAPYSEKRKIHPDWQKVFEYENDPVVYNSFLVISLHSNATPKPIKASANGVDVFVATNSSYTNKYTNSLRSNYLGELLLTNISKLSLKKNKVHMSELLMVREHNLPGVLVENGFHTNKNDRTKLLSDTFLNNLAVTYANTIADYFAYIDPLT